MDKNIEWDGAYIPVYLKVTVINKNTLKPVDSVDIEVEDFEDNLAEIERMIEDAIETSRKWEK